MLSQETEERLAERLVNRIEEANASILKKIGEAINKISTLSPSQAYQVSQILKYGVTYEEIAKELAKVSGKNVQDIYKIFDEVASQNKQFAKDFYKYREMDFIPYNKDIALQNQVRSIATLTANTYINIARTSMIGLVVDGQFKDLQQAYYDVIDKAIVSVIQGKQDFYSSMRDTLKELGGNGLVEYRSGYKRRLDSVVRTNMLEGIRQLNIETSKRFGQEYDADGIEISVHTAPAPDHADIQGKQFSNEEYEKLEAGQIARDYKGHKYNGADKRHIGEMNCYHTIFTIVLGVSKPQYTDEQLKKIQDDNEKGFEFEGKHYTNYEGTQLQRRIETEIRKAKDTQILAKASGDMELVGQSQDRITKLTHKYNELCKISGLLPKKQRMSVSEYVRTKVDNVKQIATSDYQEWLKQITDKEYKAIQKYSDVGYSDINDYLRKEYKTKNDDIEEQISLLNTATNKYITDKDKILYRGTHLDELPEDYQKIILNNNFEELIGKEYNAKSFMSTSYERENAIQFLDQWRDDNVLFRIQTEKGTNVLPIETLLNNEKEYLLKPNSNFTITGIAKTKGYNRYDEIRDFIEIQLKYNKKKRK